MNELHVRIYVQNLKTMACYHVPFRYERDYKYHVHYQVYIIIFCLEENILLCHGICGCEHKSFQDGIK